MGVEPVQVREQEVATPPACVKGQFDDAPNDTSMEEICRWLVPVSPKTHPKQPRCSNSVAGNKRVHEDIEATDIPTCAPTAPAEPIAASGVHSRGDSIAVADQDVLCGRGGKANNHVGNREFRSLIELHRQEYFTARKPRKTQISRSIVDIIRARGGRFLKQDKYGESWHDVGDAKAMEKTSQALREGAAQKFRAILSSEHNSPSSSSAFNSLSDRATLETVEGSSLHPQSTPRSIKDIASNKIARRDQSTGFYPLQHSRESRWAMDRATVAYSTADCFVTKRPRL